MWVIFQHLVCPFHASHKFITAVNYSWLHAFSFSILSQQSSLCWGLKWALCATYPAILVTELGFYIHNSTFSDIWYFFFIFFISTCFETYISCSKYQVWISVLASCTPDITPWGFFLWGYVKDYVYRNSVGDTVTHHAIIMEAIWSVLKGVLTHTWAEVVYWVDVIRAIRGFTCWGGLKYTHTFWKRNDFQSTVYLYLFWLSYSKLKIKMNKTSVDSLYQSFMVMSSLSFMCG